MKEGGLCELGRQTLRHVLHHSLSEMEELNNLRNLDPTEIRRQDIYSVVTGPAYLGTPKNKEGMSKCRQSSFRVTTV